MPGDIVTERLLASLTWEWQSAEDLVQALIPIVPPGKALRMYQNRAAGNKGTGNRPILTEDEQIASGARQIINDRIASQTGTGKVEIERLAGGRRRIKMRERREVADAHGNCRACNRPFVQATTDQPRPSSPKPSRPKVVYPTFPQWSREVAEGSSG